MISRFIPWLFLPIVVCSHLGKANDKTDGRNAGIAAAKFINDNLSTPHGSYQAVIGWVNKRPDVFPIFNERLAKLYLDALKQDPECSYGADATYWPALRNSAQDIKLLTPFMVEPTSQSHSKPLRLQVALMSSKSS